MIDIKKVSNTVCIVGLAPTTRDQALDNPEGVEMWCLNQGHATLRPEMLSRMTRWFQVHPYEEMAARQRPEFGHLEWLRDNKTIPVYMEEAHPDIPMSVRYPYEAVCIDLGGVYLTSAIAFMVALAIHEKFSVIKVYGVDMESGTEYQEMVGQVKLCQALIVDKRLIGNVIPEKLKELPVREKNLLAEYNTVVGSIRMCEELLFMALKGSGTPETAELVQATNGMVGFRHGEDRLYSKMADDGAALGDTRFWPANSPPVDISEQAEAVISLHNRRAKPAKE